MKTEYKLKLRYLFPFPAQHIVHTVHFVETKHQLFRISKLQDDRWNEDNDIKKPKHAPFYEIVGTLKNSKNALQGLKYYHRYTNTYTEATNALCEAISKHDSYLRAASIPNLTSLTM